MKHVRGYFRWLIREYLVDPEGNPYGYNCLIEQLFRKEYYYIVPLDENRAVDGLDLRDGYLAGPVPEGPCTFLEFLIALSKRLQEELVDGEPLPIDIYFWELASRLRLTEYTDDMYGDRSAPFVVDAIMTDLMDRNYDRCNSTGLFPLRGNCKDQTKVEVWYQMHAYLLENPEFFRG